EQSDDRNALRRFVTLADPEAFEIITRRYEAMVLGTCTRILGSPSDAEDAAQETFLKLARHAAQIRSNLGAWLHAAAMGCSIDLIRRSSTQRRAEHRSAVAQAIASKESIGEPIWSEIEPVLDEALSMLEPSDRDLLVARFLCTRTQREIAHELGLSEGVVSRRMQRALDRLRTQLNTLGLDIRSTTTLTALLGTIPALVIPSAIADGASKAALYEAARQTSSVASLLTSPASIKAIGLLAIGGVVLLLINRPGLLGSSKPSTGLAAATVMA
ncbi:unnamed protein product, partial [Laminaria digitata]